MAEEPEKASQTWQPIETEIDMPVSSPVRRYLIDFPPRPWREQLAGRILAGFAYRAHDVRQADDHARRAIEWADALIAEFEKEQPAEEGTPEQPSG